MNEHFQASSPGRHDTVRAYQGAEQHGLLRQSLERDACGLAFVADRYGRRSCDIVRLALGALERLAHRGATGADPRTGDGAGILLQIPHRLLRAEFAQVGVDLPAPGHYALGMLFFPPSLHAEPFEASFAAAATPEFTVLGWRDVPTNPSCLGAQAQSTQPRIRQVALAPLQPQTEDALERQLYLMRRRYEAAVRGQGAYVCSLSARTVVYKGLLMAEQVQAFYPDLQSEFTDSAIALVHQRFSTNTLPNWERAQPMRLIAHNGEINTLRGNENWMCARESALWDPRLGDGHSLAPVIEPGGSDSAALDNALELLLRGGRDLLHCVAMTMPAAWERDRELPEAMRAFYAYHANVMEPWDGPAAVVFTDGHIVGASLDRNGLRPARYVVSRDGLVVVASEVGVVPIDPEDILASHQLGPGQRFAVDTRTGEVLSNEEIGNHLASMRPFENWLTEQSVVLPSPSPHAMLPEGERLNLQQAFGYTQEDLRVILGPMASSGAEPIGSMGNDAPLAVLSIRPLPLFDYFRQLFAQVTNPPIDPLREESVMSLRTELGRQANLLAEGPDAARRLVLPSPIISEGTLGAIVRAGNPFVAFELNTTIPAPLTAAALEAGLQALVNTAVAHARGEASILVLSDRAMAQGHAALPSLLATSAVHHGLIRAGVRGRVSLIVHSGEPREVHHVAALIGFGAAAVCPWLALDSARALAHADELSPPGSAPHAAVTPTKAEANVIKALEKGLQKIMSKMGISAVASYRGAQIFEAVGLHPTLVDQWFPGTISRLAGIGLEHIAADINAWNHSAYGGPLALTGELDEGGIYQWRRRGEKHRYDPPSVALLQHAVKQNSEALYRRYAAHVSSEEGEPLTLRGLLDLVPAGPAVPLEEVEPVESLVRCFKTGAMSYGSISKEAHENLAIAMNRLGGRSNTGEGGEDPSRYVPDANGDSRRSAIKQVASGRFGVTLEYLLNADELQIKMAQGAKPGEGGQLPGHKVDDTIARLRYSTAGVGLISPPPHHDIYSIEDLAQLISDLRHANPRARISVKLVSEAGVGTVAAGVAKAGADLILISGDSGGTGASPLSSIRHAGLPWELGLAETQQALVANGLRGRVRLETDGQLRTGRDVALAAALGAEEFGFATAALVASGCILMRACHLNTCPVGIATQDPQLRARFEGKPEHVENFMRFVAQEVREVLASLGLRSLGDLVGRTDLLVRRPSGHAKASALDLSPLLHRPQGAAHQANRYSEGQPDWLEGTFDRRLMDQWATLSPATPHPDPLPVENTDRSIGTLLAAERALAAREGRPEPGPAHLELVGIAGQSLGAFLPEGMSIRLEGQANDYFGKGLSGGRLVVVPPAHLEPGEERSLRVGNVCLYGATGGDAFIRGRGGERFAVRNSGAVAVVEGVGDHGCEYMTRGEILIVGPVGRNFAAGMSGGYAYIYDPEGILSRRVNPETVECERLGAEASVRVRSLLQRHAQITGSPLAWRLLSRWESEARAAFVHVIPTEYRRALAKFGRALASGS